MTGTLRHAVRAAVLLLSLVSGLWSQEWNSPRALDLARRAVARRTAQISQAVIASYSANARGYLTFLAQIGDTAILPAKVVKQTQLAVQVFWQAPAMSKQIVEGMRDTLLTPADIGYYRDRYGIVQSNFPDRIRMGDGQDVADVLHPLAPAGLDAYDFAIVDSMTLRPGRDTIDVYQLAYRPRDPSQARAAGSAYIDFRNADIVRLDVTFTRAAILDKRIELLSVILENALIEGRAWLPWRQSVEVVRTGTWLKMNVRGIIRGRWEVCCYDVHFAPPPQLFTGPPIAFMPAEQLRKYNFGGGILDSLPPDVAIVRPEDVQRVQQQAEQLVAQSFRDRAQAAMLSVPKLSDVARVTRAEGVALGAAGELHPSTAFTIDGRARYGFADRTWKGELGAGVSLAGERSIRVFARRDYADIRDVPEASGVLNTIAAQEFGSDFTDPIDRRSAGVQITLGRLLATRWSVEAAADQDRALAVRAVPENGACPPLIPARAGHGAHVSLHADGTAIALGRGMLRASSELRFADYDGRAARLSVDAEFARRFGAGELDARTVAAFLTAGALPPQQFVYLGGPTTTPGYAYDMFAARRAVSQRIELRMTVPFFPIELGRFGSTPAHATLAPYAQAIWVDDPARIQIGGPPEEPPMWAPVRGDRQGWYPALGVGFEPLLNILRFDVARGFRGGRWTFGFDVTRSLWPIL